MVINTLRPQEIACKNLEGFSFHSCAEKLFNLAYCIHTMISRILQVILPSLFKKGALLQRVEPVKRLVTEGTNGQRQNIEFTSVFDQSTQVASKKEVETRQQEKLKLLNPALVEGSQHEVFCKDPRLQQAEGGDVLVQGTRIQLHQKEESIWAVLEAFRRFNDKIFSRKEITPDEIDDLLQDVRKWYSTYNQLRHGNPEYILDLKNPNELRILVEKTFKLDITICQVSNLSHHMNKMVDFSRGFQQEALSLLVNLETCEARGLFTLATQEGGREFYVFNPFENGSIRRVVPNQYDPRSYLSVQVVYNQT